MSKWIIKNSFQKEIFDLELSKIESWNDVIFLYSKIQNDSEIYQNNYLFFVSSTNSPFSKDEILNSLQFALDILSKPEFKVSLSKEDIIEYYDSLTDLKARVIKDSGDTFYTSIKDIS